MAHTPEENELLKRLSNGEFDGIIGNIGTTMGGSTVWKEIKNGIPMVFKLGPGGKFFNGKENEIFGGVLHKQAEYLNDEDKLWFLKKFGWLLEDDLVRKYSAKFKGKI